MGLIPKTVLVGPRRALPKPAMGGRGAFVGALPKTVVVSYGRRYGNTGISLGSTETFGVRTDCVGGCSVKELFEYMGTHISIEEQKAARAEFEVRYARWKAIVNKLQENEKAGAGCKGAVSDDRPCPPGA